MELTWMASSSASALHLADMVRRGRTPVDERLLDSGAAGYALWEELAFLGEYRDRVWGHMLGSCASVESNEVLTRLALRKAIGREEASVVTRIASGVGRAEERLREAIPGLADQLVQRLQPLLAAWEARGPGIFHHVSRLVEPAILADFGHVVGVLPIVGGAARAMLHYNHVHIEAVLADVDPQLPEVLRLAWGLLQLNVDLPMYSDTIHGDHLSLVAGLALVPITLTAGEHVELVKFTPELIDHAVSSWCVDLDLPAGAAQVVQDWWVTYLESHPPWNVAVTALDRMLAG